MEHTDSSGSTDAIEMKLDDQIQLEKSSDHDIKYSNTFLTMIN